MFITNIFKSMKNYEIYLYHKKFDIIKINIFSFMKVERCVNRHPGHIILFLLNLIPIKMTCKKNSDRS